MISRSQGTLAVAACVLELAACGQPTERTDLRPHGPPEVLSVLASDDANGDGVLEAATFCKPMDNKRPGLVPSNPKGPTQVCPADLTQGVDEVTDTVPVNWYVRIQFDELLNPDMVEDLVPTNNGSMRGTLSSTQPVKLSCGGVAVPYDGYYDPSGNSLTWPLGPSLYVTPNDSALIATGSDCLVTIDPAVVRDKDDEAVPAAQLGPYTFKIAPIALASASPVVNDAGEPLTIDFHSPVVLGFNAPIKLDELATTEVVVQEVTACDDPNPIGHPTNFAAGADKQSVQVRDADAVATTLPGATLVNAWKPATTYLVTFADGAAIKDTAGGTGALDGGNIDLICFKTTGS
jgi:hypothetical protein